MRTLHCYIATLLHCLDKLPADKNTPIYLHCEGGPMGNTAARALHELGYANLTNLKGGASAWRKAGLGFE